MDKIYLKDNYIVTELAGITTVFSKNYTVYSENTTTFFLNSSFPINNARSVTIDFSRSSSIYNEAGTIAYTTATLRSFFLANTGFKSPSGGSGGVWGSITGTLSTQTDLQSALDAKQDDLVSGTNIKTVNGNTLLGSGNLTVNSEITSGDVTTALGYTPYNSTNPNSYITSAALSSYITSTNAASTYVPQTRSLTINGVTQDLSTNRTFTVSASDASGYTTIVKSISQDVTNAGLTNDSEFQFSVIAGGHYMIDMDIALSANNTTGDYIFDFEVSAGTMTGKGTCQTLTSTGTINNIIVTAAAATSTTDISTGSATASIDDIFTARVLFAFTASANATFRYKFGNASPANNRTSRTWKGSIMKYKSLD